MGGTSEREGLAKRRWGHTRGEAVRWPLPPRRSVAFWPPAPIRPAGAAGCNDAICGGFAGRVHTPLARADRGPARLALTRPRRWDFDALGVHSKRSHRRRWNRPFLQRCYRRPAGSSAQPAAAAGWRVLRNDGGDGVLWGGVGAACSFLAGPAPLVGKCLDTQPYAEEDILVEAAHIALSAGRAQHSKLLVTAPINHPRSRSLGTSAIFRARETLIKTLLDRIGRPTLCGALSRRARSKAKL